MTEMERIENAARAAGLEAGLLAKPIPMIVEGGFTVSEGLCGMAYVKVYGNGNGRKFINWCKKQNIGFKPSVGTGWQIPCHYFNQSVTRKVEYCAAFSAELSKHGILSTVIEWVN